MSTYDHKATEDKWKNKWYNDNLYEAVDFSSKPKKYILAEFPYPSGKALHAGHMMRFTLPDVYSRYLRMRGYNVLFPMGWDAFGLPAENYAVKTGINPAASTKEIIGHYRSSILSMGYGIDVNREINTTDPNYYKWTQWIFLKLYQAGLAEYKEMPIWWCETLKTVLADEEVLTDKNGNKISERGEYPVERKMFKQWVLKIPEYAEKLIEGLKKVDFPEAIKTAQINWIGKSTGAFIDFPIFDEADQAISNIKVFTTRPDTIYGVTFLAIAPENPIVGQLIDDATNKQEVKNYIEATKNKTDLERQTLKEKTGVVLEGIYAKNPMDESMDQIPVYLADYILMEYGTGSIMGVPAHDDRDFEFAIKHNIEIKKVIETPQESKESVLMIHGWGNNKESGFFPGLEENLNSKGYNIINETLPNTENPKYDEWYNYLEETIKKLDSQKVTLVGHSTGGYIALKLAEKLQLKRLILVSPVSPTHTFSENRQKLTREWLNGEVLENYLSFHKEDINQNDVVKNVKDITFVFGLKDPYIDEQAREYFKEKFNNIAKILIFENYGHMGSSEGLQHIKEIEKLFPQSLYSGVGLMFNSEKYSGLDSNTFKNIVTEKLTADGKGKPATTYRIRDWVFSRQRYWGEPIPMLHLENGTIEPICDPDNKIDVQKILPLVLPEVPDYNPTSDGSSPLERNTNWVNTTDKDGKPAKRETNTMPNWAGSSWYYLRYCDPKNHETFAGWDKLKYWLPVDKYFGGAEHITLHLLYSRFWHHFLYDQGLVPTEEPYAWRMTGGLLLGPDGKKMSKSRGNVIEPMDFVDKYGADALRMFICFLGPYEDTYPWNDNGLKATYRLLSTIWELKNKVNNEEESPEITKAFNKTLKRVSSMCESLKMNTVVSEIMIFVNEAKKAKNINVETWKKFIKTIAPLAPFLAEELWQEINGYSEWIKENSVHLQLWPTYDEKLTEDATSAIPVQINGKVRSEVSIVKNEDENSVKEKVMQDPKIQKLLNGENVKKFIYIKDKIVNIVL